MASWEPSVGCDRKVRLGLYPGQTPQVTFSGFHLVVMAWGEELPDRSGESLDSGLEESLSPLTLILFCTDM